MKRNHLHNGAKMLRRTNEQDRVGIAERSRIACRDDRRVQRNAGQKR
jgi:hypothetical protein